MMRYVLPVCCIWLFAGGSGAQPNPCELPLVTDSGQETNYTILDVAREVYACTMVRMIERAGLAPMFREKGPFTLFAPYDLAFGFLPNDIWNKLMSNNTYLRELLLFHTVPRLIGPIEDIHQDELLATMLPGKNIRLNIYQMQKSASQSSSSKWILAGGRGNMEQDENATGVSVNGWTRITACGGPIIDGGNGTNGWVRVISNVMHPVPPGDIMEVIDHDKQFSTLKRLVYKAKLQEYLKGGPFTFFPPNDDGFDKVPKEVLEEFEKNVTLLRELLTYHLLDWTLYASGSYEGEVLVTVQGEAISLTVWYDALWVNGYKNAKVLYQDYNVYNGVLHIIDNVLIPPMMRDKFKASQHP